MKTPEEFAREADEELGRRGQLSVDGSWQVCVEVIAAAIRAHAAQSPVAGSPLSDERLAEIVKRDERYRKWMTDRGYTQGGPQEGSLIVKDDRTLLVAELMFLRSIMHSPEQEIHNERYEKARREGFAAGAEAQREACANTLEAGSHLYESVQAVHNTPLATEGA